MTDAVIVSTARTGLAKSWKGAFNMTYGATLGGHAVQHAVASAPASTPAKSKTCIMGGTFGEGTTGGNVARAIALRAGLPVTTAGLTINRFCSSGLQSHRPGRAAHHRPKVPGHRGRRRRASAACRTRPTSTCAWTRAAGAQARALLEHAADRRAGGQALQHPKLAQDEYGVRSQQRAFAAAGRPASSTTRSCR
jgi:acetyl-CoA C-acetyltransferase